MKHNIVFFTMIILASMQCSSMGRSVFNPGCIRQNSDELRRDMIFCAIDAHNFDFLLKLLDPETVDYKNPSGETVIERLDYIAKLAKVDVAPVLAHIQKVKTEKKD